MLTISATVCRVAPVATSDGYLVRGLSVGEQTLYSCTYLSRIQGSPKLAHPFTSALVSQVPAMLHMVYFCGITLCDQPHLEAAPEIQIPTGSHVFTCLSPVPIFCKSNPNPILRPSPCPWHPLRLPQVPHVFPPLYLIVRALPWRGPFWIPLYLQSGKSVR